MKKKYLHIVFIVFISFLLASCGKKISDEDLVDIWDKNVTLVSNFNIDLIEDETLTDEQIFDRIKKEKNKIDQSNMEVKKLKGNKDIIDSVIKINDIISLTYSYSENLIRGNKFSTDEEKSGYLLGVENRSFADKYNYGLLPKAFSNLITYSTENNSSSSSDNKDVSSSDSSIKTDTSNAEETGSDITKLSKTPTDEQKETLLFLANQKFKQDFPYKGSKLHSILGVLQDWTQDGESWYYKSQATIVNSYGTKEDVNVEISITPTSRDTGVVEIISY